MQLEFGYTYDLSPIKYGLGGGGEEDMIRAECAGMSGLNGNNSQSCCDNIGI